MKTDDIQKYIKRKGFYKVEDQKITILINYEETNEYELIIKNSKQWYKYIFYSDKGLLIDNNTSIYHLKQQGAKQSL